MSNIRSVQWGQIHEEVAVKQFEESLWLDECGFLGASPDGLVNNESIVEIKCPYKYKDKEIVEELANNRDKSYILYYDENTQTLMINKNHDYYHQIQGQLAITGRKLCYLAIWTPKLLLVEPVELDEGWKANLDKLKSFYLNTYLKHVLKD